METFTEETVSLEQGKKHNETLDTINTRRAVRKYQSTQLSTEHIQQIIDAGRMAPSAMNKQPWLFYVVNQQSLINHFSKEIFRAAFVDTLKTGLTHPIQTAKELILFPKVNFHLDIDDVIFHGAPLVVFISSPKSNQWADLDIGMCAQNMMLAAKSLGIDSCPIGLAKFVEHSKSYGLLGVPAAHRINLALIFGYGSEVPEVHERKKNNVFFINSPTPGAAAHQ